MSESKMVNQQSICSNRENFHSFDERINPINERSDRANSVIHGLWSRQGNSWSKRQIFSSQSQSRIFVNVSGKTFILSHLLVVVILHIHVFLPVVVAICYSKTLKRFSLKVFCKGKRLVVESKWLSCSTMKTTLTSSTRPPMLITTSCSSLQPEIMFNLNGANRYKDSWCLPSHLVRSITTMKSDWSAGHVGWVVHRRKHDNWRPHLRRGVRRNTE